MKDNKLLKTNLLVSIILIFGFSTTAVFSYRANYQASLSKIEQVSALTMEGIYYQLSTVLTKPVNISITMAHDSLMVKHLSNEAENLDNEDYIRTIQGYLDAYREKYSFDSVFLVSTVSGRYYSFKGVDRVLTPDNPENEWYYNLLDSEQEYSMNVDNDEVIGSNDAITVFVNCKIIDSDNTVLGIVGVGVRVDYLKEFLRSYEEKYGIDAYMVNEDGIIEISTTHTGYEKVNWFSISGNDAIREQLLGWHQENVSMELWTDREGIEEKSYVVARYIPELSWHLIVDQNNGDILRAMRLRLYQAAAVIIIIILLILVIITTVIRNFNKQITKLMEERQAVFKRATEKLYDNIYELNITKNCPANVQTVQFFESLGAKGMPYSQGLGVIAEKQIREEHREGYVNTFSPENVKREYELGNSHLQYDFMITQDGGDYFWMRIDAYVFYSQEDNCLHMFTYRKNINEDKKKEWMAITDGMTGFLNKTATKNRIDTLLSEDSERFGVFFIFDIDNFKTANDCFGHAFGDYCIKEFTGIIRRYLGDCEVLGRVGGDEFVAFVFAKDTEWPEKNAMELSRALDTSCVKDNKSWKMSASIGVSLSPQNGRDFDSLYEKADAALYTTKQKGKNNFTIYTK